MGDFDDMAGVVVFLVPVVAELSSPQSVAGRHLANAVPRSPYDFTKEIFVFGRSNEAGFSSHPGYELPVAVRRLELAHLTPPLPTGPPCAGVATCWEKVIQRFSLV